MNRNARLDRSDGGNDRLGTGARREVAGPQEEAGDRQPRANRERAHERRAGVQKRPRPRRFERQQLAQRGRAFAEAHYDRDVLARRYLDLLREVTGKP